MPKPLYTAASGHPQRRKAADLDVLAGRAVCGFCGQLIVPGKVRLRPTAANPLGRLVSNWDLDHTTGGPAHLFCNRSHGGRKGNASPRRRGRRRPTVIRTWGAW